MEFLGYINAIALCPSWITTLHCFSIKLNIICFRRTLFHFSLDEVEQGMRMTIHLFTATFIGLCIPALLQNFTTSKEHAKDKAMKKTLHLAYLMSWSHEWPVGPTIGSAVVPFYKYLATVAIAVLPVPLIVYLQGI